MLVPLKVSSKLWNNPGLSVTSAAAVGAEHSHCGHEAVLEHSRGFWLKFPPALVIAGTKLGRIEAGLALVALGGGQAVLELQGGKDKRVLQSLSCAAAGKGFL